MSMRTNIANSTIRALKAINEIVRSALSCDLKEMLVRNRCSDRRPPSHRSASVPAPLGLRSRRAETPVAQVPSLQWPEPKLLAAILT